MYFYLGRRTSLACGLVGRERAVVFGPYRLNRKLYAVMLATNLVHVPDTAALEKIVEGERRRSSFPQGVAVAVPAPARVCVCVHARHCQFTGGRQKAAHKTERRWVGGCPVDCLVAPANPRFPVRYTWTNVFRRTHALFKLDETIRPSDYRA